jgi:hypothetical protein
MRCFRFSKKDISFLSFRKHLHYHDLILDIRYWLKKYDFVAMPSEDIQSLNPGPGEYSPHPSLSVLLYLRKLTFGSPASSIASSIPPTIS